MSSSSAHDRHRSPSRIAAPTPKPSDEPSHSLPRCSVAKRRCAAGMPRRVSQPSMTSSWMSAQACSSSSAVAARDGLLAVGAAGAAPAPVGEGRAQPLAAAQQVGERLGQGREVGADVVEDRHLHREEVVEPLLHADPEVLRVQRRDRCPRGCHALQARGGPLFRHVRGRSVPVRRVSAVGPSTLRRGVTPYPRRMSRPRPFLVRRVADRRSARWRPAATSFSFEFFPPQDRRRRAPALAGDPRARGAAALLRLGDLRRRGLDARPHGARHRAHRRARRR